MVFNMNTENENMGLYDVFTVYGQALNYPKRKIIFQKGESPDKIYFIVKGRVRVYCVNEYGDEMTFFYIDENQTFGSDLLANLQRRIISVDCDTDVQLYYMDINVFIEECIKNKKSVLNFIECLNNKIVTLTNYISYSRYTKANERLAYFLYTNSIDGVVNYTHEQIAIMTCMNRVSVTRLLNNFETENLIKQQYKEIKIINMKGLDEIFKSVGYFID